MSTQSEREAKLTRILHEHRDRVAKYLVEFAIDLQRRALVHDDSKFEKDEFPIYASMMDEFAANPFGTDGYFKAKDAIKEATTKHFATNRHHPEYNRQSEEWRPVSGFETSYLVSNFGEIKSIERIVVRKKQGNIKKKSQILHQYVTPKGYCRVQLTSGSRYKNVMVHDIVAKAFIPNPQNKPIVNHKNGNKIHNYVSNLEWATHSENLIHAYESGLKDSNVKYVVTCDTLGITTIGLDAMEKELRKRGYEKARASAIWRCIDDPSAKHLDLSFSATNFEKWMVSPVNDMNLIDLLEMLADWKAATLNHPESPGNMVRSLDYAVKKYGISPQLATILLNTIENYNL